MKPRTFRLSILSAALAPCIVHAVGLGEMVLHSRVGEPLRAEVPLIAHAGELMETACFSLASVHGADLPVITSGKIRLVQGVDGHRLIVTGSKPISEPIFMLAIQAGCGIDLQRDYVLMPQAPLMLADAAETNAPTATAPGFAPKRGNVAYREILARQGETLEAIAEAQAPGSLAQQRRLTAALKRANPDLAAEQSLTEGTVVRLPERLGRTSAERESFAAPPSGEGRPASAAPRPKAAKSRPSQAPETGGKANDRLLLSAAEEIAKPGEKRSPSQISLSEAEDRMLKLENTIQQLNQEIDKMNAALALANQTLEAQQKLQQAQSQLTQSNSAVIKATAASLPEKSDGGWTELLLSALGGGAIAVGLASFLARRRQNPLDAEAPLALNGYRPEIQVRPAPMPPTPDAQAVQAHVDTAAESLRSSFSQAEVNDLDMTLDDDNAVLELADIMLAFGRIRGAADTLAQHIETSSPNNIRPWTMLLDLYRRGDMQAEFDVLAARMRSRFNIHIPEWGDHASPVSGLKSLEDYAHIMGRICHAWGTQQCLDYLYDLSHDNRSGQRSGFPLEVIEEISLLMRLLESGYGLSRPA